MLIRSGARLDLLEDLGRTDVYRSLVPPRRLRAFPSPFPLILLPLQLTLSPGTALSLPMDSDPDPALTKSSSFPVDTIGRKRGGGRSFECLGLAAARRKAE